MMQAGEFAPTLHSKLTYNEAFRANQYVAAGIKPIYVLNHMFQSSERILWFYTYLSDRKERVE